MKHEIFVGRIIERLLFYNPLRRWACMSSVARFSRLIYDLLDHNLLARSRINYPRVPGL